jgi:hypothetical protein
MVLHWLDDPEGFLRAAARSCRPGRLAVVIPNAPTTTTGSPSLRKVPRISLSHKNIMTPPECEVMFRAAGYVIERLTATKTGLKARWWPRVFGSDLLYLLKPVSPSAGGPATP